jgi:hypothetical protein
MVSIRRSPPGGRWLTGARLPGGYFRSVGRLVGTMVGIGGGLGLHVLHVSSVCPLKNWKEGALPPTRSREWEEAPKRS